MRACERASARVRVNESGRKTGRERERERARVKERERERERDRQRHTEEDTAGEIESKGGRRTIGSFFLAVG